LLDALLAFQLLQLWVLNYDPQVMLQNV